MVEGATATNSSQLRLDERVLSTGSHFARHGGRQSDSDKLRQRDTKRERCLQVAISRDTMASTQRAKHNRRTFGARASRQAPASRQEPVSATCRSDELNHRPSAFEAGRYPKGTHACWLTLRPRRPRPPKRRVQPQRRHAMSSSARAQRKQTFTVGHRNKANQPARPLLYRRTRPKTQHNTYTVIAATGIAAAWGPLASGEKHRKIAAANTAIVFSIYALTELLHVFEAHWLRLHRICLGSTLYRYERRRHRTDGGEQPLCCQTLRFNAFYTATLPNVTLLTHSPHVLKLTGSACTPFGSGSHFTDAPHYRLVYRRTWPCLRRKSSCRTRSAPPTDHPASRSPAIPGGHGMAWHTRKAAQISRGDGFTNGRTRLLHRKEQERGRAGRATPTHAFHRRQHRTDRDGATKTTQGPR